MNPPAFTVSDLSDDPVEVAYYDRFHLAMRRSDRRYLCRMGPSFVFDSWQHDSALAASLLFISRLLHLNPDDVCAELEDIGRWSGRPFAPEDLRDHRRNLRRLALNAARQIAIDEERRLKAGTKPASIQGPT